MPIRDKNGEILRLRGPNPLMNDQSEWDRSQMRLINMRWNGEVIKDAENPYLAAKAKIRDIGKELDLNPTKAISGKDFLEELVQTPEAAPVVKASVPQAPPTPPPVTNTVVLDVDQRVLRLMEQRGVQYYCAPVVDMKSHVDSLYGSSYQSPVYGKPFVFDAIVVDQSDLQLQFWCIRAVPKGSIVYQAAKGGEWERRWWRVEQLTEKTGGYLVIAHISDTNPDFS